MTEQPFGTDPFTPATPTTVSGELETEFFEDRILAPAPGESVALTHGPLVEQNTEVRDTSGVEYALGLHYFETLAVSPGRIENLTVPEGTPLVVRYFYYEAQGVDGTSSVTTDDTGTRFASLYKLGG